MGSHTKCGAKAQSPFIIKNHQAKPNGFGADEGTCSASLSRQGGKCWVSIICRRQAIKFAIVSAIPTRSSPLLSGVYKKNGLCQIDIAIFGADEGT